MFNRFENIGRLTADGNLKYLANGTPVAEFTVASNFKYGDSDEVLFMKCVYFGKGAEAVSPYLTKGTLVFTEGRLKEEKWDKDGVSHKDVKNIVSNVRLISTPKETTTKGTTTKEPF
jgi:single-strand DNA-binding protein